MIFVLTPGFYSILRTDAHSGSSED